MTVLLRKICKLKTSRNEIRFLLLNADQKQARVYVTRDLLGHLEIDRDFFGKIITRD